MVEVARTASDYCEYHAGTDEQCVAYTEDLFESVLVDDEEYIDIDEDSLRRAVERYDLAYAAVKRRANRFCTYTMYSHSKDRYYSGRTSSATSCDAAVAIREAAHRAVGGRFDGFGRAITEKRAFGGESAYSAIRGREQQLIDHFGGVGSDRVENKIRGVAKLNKKGCVYHRLSNEKFGSLYRYTGLLPGC